MSYSLELEQVLHSNRAAINALAKRHGVRNIRVFGSLARGEAGAESDIDLLVDIEPGRSLFDLGGFQMDMQALLGRRVDVVTEKALHWYIRDRVLSEAIVIDAGRVQIS